MRFNTDGWSTTIFQANDPVLEVLLYVNTGSGRPIKSVDLNPDLMFSLKVKAYGGNHITLPPLGPLSQTGRSAQVNPGLFDVLQAKFSIENIYFFAYPSIPGIKFVDA